METQFWIGVHGLIEADGRLLILRRAPRMTYCPGRWDLPGGHLAVGESFEECLRREVGEETGLTVRIGGLAGVNKAPGPYVQMIYRCVPADGDRAVTVLADEHDASRWLAVGELAALATADELIPYLRQILTRGLLDYLK